jgi:hypothetical protein
MRRRCGFTSEPNTITASPTKMKLIDRGPAKEQGRAADRRLHATGSGSPAHTQGVVFQKRITSPLDAPDGQAMAVGTTRCREAETGQRELIKQRPIRSSSAAPVHGSPGR